MDEDINMRNNMSTRLSMAATVVGLLLAVSPVQAQKTVVTLWPNGAPGSENWTQTEAEYPMGTSGTKGVRNVSGL